MTPNAVALLPLLTPADITPTGVRHGAWSRLARRIGVSPQRVRNAIAPGAGPLRPETLERWRDAAADWHDFRPSYPRPSESR